MKQPSEVTKINLGGILLDCTTAEEITLNADVTERPVEQGEDISDHMKTKPYEVKLAGSMHKDDADSKISRIEALQKDAELVEYIGKRRLKDMVVTSFSTRQNKHNLRGYDWTISLQSVKIAKPKSAKQKTKNPETKKADPKVDTKVKEITNAGRKRMQNTNNRNTNYTNIKSNPSRMTRQKPIKKSKNPSYPGIHNINNTNPVHVRNRMLATLNQGTANRAQRLMNNSGKVSRTGGRGSFGGGSKGGGGR